LPQNRVGYAIGKRVGNAVTRNLVRRRLRMIVRSLPLLTGHDIVITARPQAASVTFEELREAFESCARRSKLLMAENG
jgi:ribonuclease P protein component